MDKNSTPSYLSQISVSVIHFDHFKIRYQSKVIEVLPRRIFYEMNVREFEDSVSSETPTEIYSSEDEVGGENQVNEMCGIVCRYLFEQLFVIQMSHIEIFCFLIQGLKIRPWKTLADEVHNLWQVSEPALFVALKDTLPEAYSVSRTRKEKNLA